MSSALIQRRLIQLCLWVAAGVLLGLSSHFPSTALSPLLAIFFAIFFPGMFLVLRTPRYSRIFIFGLAANLTIFCWLAPVIQTYGSLDTGKSWFIAVVLAILASVQFLVFNFIFRGLRHFGFTRYRLALPLAWLAAEVLVPKMVPWQLGATLIQITPVAQLADLFGVSLLSALLLWWGSLVAELVLRFFHEAFSLEFTTPISKPLILLLSSLVVVFVYGAVRIASISAAVEEAHIFSAIITQGNLDPQRDFEYSRKGENIEKYQRITRPHLNEVKPDLVIWPESSVGHDYFADEKIIRRGRPRDPFPGLEVPLIFGGQILVNRKIRANSNWYNSAILMHPSGKIGGPYKKQVLFPFSEYNPLRGYTKALDSLFGEVDFFLKGKNQGSLDFTIPRKDRPLDVRAAIAICFEDLYPEIFQRSVRDNNANILINLTNDAWFHDSVTAEQHSMMAAWRAIENRRFLVRATNNGVTSVISPLGRTVDRLPRLTESVMTTKNLRLIESRSLFQFVGTLPIYILSLIIALSSLYGWSKRT